MISIDGFESYRWDRCKADAALITNKEIPGQGGGIIIYANRKWVKYIKIFSEGTKKRF